MQNQTQTLIQLAEQTGGNGSAAELRDLLDKHALNNPLCYQAKRLMDVGADPLDTMTQLAFYAIVAAEALRDSQIEMLENTRQVPLARFIWPG